MTESPVFDTGLWGACSWGGALRGSAAVGRMHAPQHTARVHLASVLITSPQVPAAGPCAGGGAVGRMPGKHASMSSTCTTSVARAISSSLYYLRYLQLDRARAAGQWDACLKDYARVQAAHVQLLRHVVLQPALRFLGTCSWTLRARRGSGTHAWRTRPASTSSTCTTSAATTAIAMWRAS